LKLKNADDADSERKICVSQRESAFIKGTAQVLHIRFKILFREDRKEGIFFELRNLRISINTILSLLSSQTAK
jgi:hypothetical protein